MLWVRGVEEGGGVGGGLAGWREEESGHQRSLSSPWNVEDQRGLSL